MMKKKKSAICSVLIFVLIVCIICTGCTSTQNTPATSTQSPPTQSPPPQSTPTQSTPAQSTPGIPEQTLTPEDTSAQPASTPAPGDPSTVLVSYPSLFNTGNGAGLFALLSENMKVHYPIDTLNNKFTQARSDNTSIERIQVNNQIIEETSATVESTVSWNVGGTLATSTPRFFMVYENGQWKLDSLIFHPSDT
jgi:hypothetical protein